MNLLLYEFNNDRYYLFNFLIFKSIHIINILQLNQYLL